MSRNSRPTTEELRFVYDLILKGYDDADVLEEYARLYDAVQLMFPYRTDKRFVRECRKELEAAKGVLERHSKAVDPIVAERKKEHFNHLAKIIEYIIPERTAKIEAVGSEFITTGVDGKQSKVTRKMLSDSVNL